jgi:serine/threonine protein kinase
MSTDQFVQQLVESSLMSPADITAIIDSLPAERKPHDGEQLAKELVRLKKLTAYQAQQIYVGKGRSLVLGEYVILDKLGQGGMGLVLKAEHRRMKRLVALKVLSPKVTKTPEALRRFQREVEAAARLTHPNIVIAHDAGEAGGTHFLVTEYVRGASGKPDGRVPQPVV